MLHCIIIEDQPPAQRILKKYISDTDTLTLKETFADTIKATAYLKENQIDVIFLDIHLPKVSGIDFLKSTPNHPNVILTTAFSDYALESYQYNVIDYLLKPISYERFLQAISKLQVLQKEKKPKDLLETIYIKSGYELIKLKASDIIHIKSDADYTEIITAQKTHISKNSLKHWLEKLDSNYFCQVHKSYLINIQYLVKVSGNTVYLTNTVIPIGRAYKKYFMTHYLNDGV
ncbi:MULTISPECIES: LytR/AlgR family response regulator transcription factor [Aquimarina]|uniref:LytR/AlgR family response regulator transcription factor n=1 Tax=Aquimarina TaxID=290174 RepID=UPI000CDE6180|nr:MULTISPECIES: LytTR family DNA-binding domain-containing protein [Aquimarina]